MTDPARHRIAEEGAEMRELKPCPFCGDSAMVSRFGLTAEVMCTNCNARSPAFHITNEGKAIAAWNARAAIEALGGEQVLALVPVNRRMIGERDG